MLPSTPEKNEEQVTGSEQGGGNQREKEMGRKKSIQRNARLRTGNSPDRRRLPASVVLDRGRAQDLEHGYSNLK
jgi:hypothetical protein